MARCKTLLSIYMIINDYNLPNKTKGIALNLGGKYRET